MTLPADGEVHRTHCCFMHGCKYGDHTTCPVTTGKVMQAYACEDCATDERVNRMQALEEALRYCRAEAERYKKTPAAWAPAVIDRVNAVLKEGPYLRVVPDEPEKEDPLEKYSKEQILEAVVKHCKARGMFTTAESIEAGDWVMQLEGIDGER